MKKYLPVLLAMMCLLVSGYAQEASDYPLLSQGMLEPPPPPPGYAAPVQQILPPVDGPPNPPMLPQAQNPAPDSAPAPRIAAAPEVRQAISRELYEKVKEMMRSIYTFRTVIDAPESGEQLRRLQNLGRICSELLTLHRYPSQSRIMPSHSDKVLRDRSYEAVEYRHFGDFDMRLNGWIKPIDSAVYIDLVFDGRGRRRTHIRAQVTRKGTLDGYFYAYGWDKFGRNWKLQGQMNNLLSFDNGLPYSGDIVIYGADPAGKTMSLGLKFPVKVTGILEPQRKEIRHREGRPVSIGN